MSINDLIFATIFGACRKVEAALLAINVEKLAFVLLFYVPGVQEGRLWRVSLGVALTTDSNLPATTVKHVKIRHLRLCQRIIENVVTTNWAALRLFKRHL